MSETEDDLRTTAQSIAADAERLKQVEEAKTELAVDDPKLGDLTEKAERIIDEISAKGVLQSALVEELQRRDSGSTLWAPTVASGVLSCRARSSSLVPLRDRPSKTTAPRTYTHTGFSSGMRR